MRLHKLDAVSGKVLSWSKVCALVLFGQISLGVEPVFAASKQVSNASTANKAPCLIVNRVEIEGVKLLKLADLQTKTDLIVGKCIDGLLINAALEAISFAYIDKGYITTRAYVPSQNIKATKTLKLVVVEGKLEGFYKDGKPASANTEIAQAFPGLAGKELNMRDIEQGLDQMNALSGVQAKTDLVASKTPGGTFVNVTGAPVPKANLSLATNNHGSKSTGFANSSATLGLNDFFHGNEALSLTYSHSGPYYPVEGEYGMGYSNSIAGSLNIPYGYWTGNIYGNYYGYISKIPGIFSLLETSGTSENYGGSLSRVIARDSKGKTSLTFGFDHKATHNFLLGNAIVTSTRRYDVLSASLDKSLKALGGQWTFNATYSHGADIIGATKPGEVGVGNADPLFGKLSGTISYLAPFKLGPLPLEYSGKVTGQWSPSNLLGSEQISLGGFSNVRGSREAQAFGNNGLYMRNQLDITGFQTKGALAPILGEIRPYVGLDYGHIFGQSELGIVSSDVAGYTIGIHNKNGKFTFDAGYSKLLLTPKSELGSGVIFVGGSVAF